jgi:hypothetical protein
MPTRDDQEALQRAHEDERAGKSPSTQAGEFVREEIDHVREGKHGAANVKQAIAIGLSKARRAGIKLPVPASGSSEVRRHAEQDLEKSKSPNRKISAKRSRATLAALKKESKRTVSRSALSSQAKASARQRGATARRRSAAKAARTRRH